MASIQFFMLIPAYRIGMCQSYIHALNYACGHICDHCNHCNPCNKIFVGLTLMTRGQKGCFIYCINPALQQYFKDRLDKVMFYKKKREKMLYLIDDQEEYGDFLN